MEQVAIGTVITLVSIAVSAGGFWIAEVVFMHNRDWLRAPPHSLKLLLVVVSAGGVVLSVVLAGVAIWTSAFLWMRIFQDPEEAFYFALTSYTTLGYGDVLPPAQWRLLGAMAAANGFINIGLLTTLLLEGLGHVRAGYHRTVFGRDFAD